MAGGKANQRFGNIVSQKVQKHLNILAGKITSILLEFDTSDLQDLLNDEECLLVNIEESVAILLSHSHQKHGSVNDLKKNFSIVTREYKPKFLDMITNLTLKHTKEKKVGEFFGDFCGDDFVDDTSTRSDEDLQWTTNINLPVTEHKRIIGDRLFPLVQTLQPNLAGKITGMLLENSNELLLQILEDRELLTSVVEKAVKLLEDYEQIDNEYLCRSHETDFVDVDTKSERGDSEKIPTIQGDSIRNAQVENNTESKIPIKSDQGEGNTEPENPYEVDEWKANEEIQSVRMFLTTFFPILTFKMGFQSLEIVTEWQS